MEDNNIQTEEIKKEGLDNDKEKEQNIDNMNNTETDSSTKDIDGNTETKSEQEENKENVDSNEDNKLKESEEKYKRLLAEFDNYRKRTEKEKTMMTDFGATLILTQFLNIVDNIERAVSNIPEDIKDNPFVDGIKKIYDQLLKTLEDLKVTPIKSKGEKFDQNLHNAVLMDEESDEESGIITEELQKGYMYKDQVLRHSMVKVKK